jgi:lysophospholipase L1-like esterase
MTHFNYPTRWLAAFVVAVLSLVSIVPSVQTARLAAMTQSDLSRFPPQVKFTGDGDHQNMMDQLGIKALRPGANPNDPSTFDETTANKYPLPELMVMKNGTKVTKVKQWPARRAEIQEDFEREVYGRIPKNVPKVNWEVTNTSTENIGGIPGVTKTLVGHVDNSSYPLIRVDVQASMTTPANAKGPVPLMVEFDWEFRRAPTPPAWQQQLIAKGWGYGRINPTSVQADGPALTSGIIGLTNKGQPRKPEDWGALRAWQWGVSRLLDYFETDKTVDARQVGIEGLSRYGKAALVTEAFEPRIAIGFIGSSGEGGAKLHRHIFGEAVENLTGGEYYWMAGNFMKYGASQATFGPQTAGDLPVDSHQLIALCAPRPCFISYGVVEKGDAEWVDAHGSFMAAVAAGPAYRLLGKRNLGTPGNYLTDPMPSVGKLIGGELAWRQHNGGHSVAENWPAFIEWASQFINPPRVRADARSARQQMFTSNSASGLNISVKKHSQLGTGAAPAADQPTPRSDQNSLIAHAQLLEKARKGRIDVYFEGDSITRRWGTSDEQYKALLANWRENFFGWNAADFGWGGDTTQNILWRLKNGELDNVNPKIIVVMVGTNNVGKLAPQGSEDPRVADTTRGIKAILDICQLKAPNATIVLMGITPRNDNLAVMPIINQINDNIARFADGKKIKYLNINDRLADKDGKLFEGMANADGLHLDVKGYQVWADALKPLFSALLGPPAKEDHAPPPTGDPSTTKISANSHHHLEVRA